MELVAKKESNKKGEEKHCTKCGADLVDGANYRQSRRKCRKYLCNACNATSFRKSFLWTKYGITPEEYDEMYERQGGNCGCCGRHQTEFLRRLAVDHVHGSDPTIVRGLLCPSCNSGIGKLGDNIEGVEQALDYLRKFENANY